MSLSDTIESLGLTYRASFVPFSVSRNAKLDPKLRDLSLNWKISLSKGSHVIATDYQAGIAHVPGYKNGTMSVDLASAIREACETGKTSRTPGSIFSSKAPIPAPSLSDVLYALVSDAGAIDSHSFEDWASEFGYDKDSRHAEKIYRACLDTGLKLRAMLGDSKLTELREAFQDY